jgi:hypothetical protein
VLAPSSQLPWEDAERPWRSRLWQTALASSLEPRCFFGELPSGAVEAALAFAIWAEALALGSTGLCAGLLLWLAAPEFAHALFASWAARGVLVALWVGSVPVMLCLHVLWGVSLDAGAGRAARRGSWAQGVRFGLYACGWDLITSPAGALIVLFTRGPRRGWASLGAAVRAPRLAQRAYLEACRGYPALVQRRAVRLSMLSVGGAVVLFVLGLLLMLALLAHELGY